jgi:hypothetical protein
MAEKDWGTETYLDPTSRKYKKRKVYKGTGESTVGKRFTADVVKKKPSYGAKEQADALSMPKQKEGESPAAYGARIRAWREKQKKKPE